MQRLPVTLACRSLFSCGDDVACNEARNLLGSLTCVTVKKAISRYSAIMLPEAEVLESLRHGAIEAIEKRDYWNIFYPPRPSTLTLTMVDPNMCDAAELLQKSSGSTIGSLKSHTKTTASFSSFFLQSGF